MTARLPSRPRAFTFARHLLPLPPLFSAVLALSACRAETEAPQKEEPPPAPAATSAPPPRRPARAASTATGAETWNAEQIEWLSYDAGLARAKAENKPVCLVFFTTWCPHCKNYSKVFDDPRVVERAKQLVMIHLDADQESDIAKQYAPDGSYIPRTFFLAPDGKADFEIQTGRKKFAYFYNERDPASLLAGMDEALKKLRR